MLEYKDGGESHFSPVMTGIIAGIPEGLALDEKFINRELQRRQWGLGRGFRSLRHKDTINITSGVRSTSKDVKTLGTPISLEIKNRGEIPKPITIPRPCRFACDVEIRLL